MRATSAPWVCVLNSDATPAPDWLAQLIAAPRDERTWALGSVLVSAATGLIESAGDAYAPEGYAYKLLRERPLDDLPAEPYPVFAAPGAAPVFRRDVFDPLGGYEERFFLYYEDVDLAFRAVLAGYHALLVPSARVVHRLGATTRSMARLRFYVARNSMWCAVRCLPEPPAAALARRWLAELRSNRPRRSRRSRSPAGSPGWRACRGRCTSAVRSRRGAARRRTRSTRCCGRPPRSARGRDRDRRRERVGHAGELLGEHPEPAGRVGVQAGLAAAGGRGMAALLPEAAGPGVARRPAESASPRTATAARPSRRSARAAGWSGT